VTKRVALLGVLMVATLAVAAGPARAASQAGLVAAYGFDEGSGSFAQDGSGAGNTGSLSGGATWAAGGRFGGALTFNGTSALVSVPDAAALDLTSAMTISAWVNPSSSGGWRSVILKEQPNNLLYGLYDRGRDRPSSFRVRAAPRTDPSMHC